MESKILGGRYQLLEKIGMGGMAIVYKALDDLLSRYVAIKILREEYKENEEFIRRFKVESQAAASLSHQNIVQIYDVGEEDGIHYIVMELLEGETLKSYMNSKGERLSFKEAINFSMQICRALEHAHSKHVVHRDIKPHNIVLTSNGKIKVADFGIARAANNNTTVDSVTHAVGSAHYLSPEQARGGYTDHKSDIYSLGVVMYEMFTGKLPFDAEESISIVMQHIHEEAPLPSEVAPDIPEGIEAIIMRAMSKEQRLRYENATQILEDLVKVYQNPSVSIRELNAFVEEPAKSQPKRTNVEKKSSAPQRSVKKKKKKSRKGLFIGLAAFFIIVVALATIPLWMLIFGTGSEFVVPDVVGMTLEEAIQKAEDASDGNVKFTVKVTHKEYSEEERDTILSQTPEGGFQTKRSKEIKVTMSLGPVALELGDYTGRNYLDVMKILEKKGIKVILEQEDNAEYDEGEIFKQFPTEGTKRASGEEVTLYVSKGSENTVVPDVVGKTDEEAIAIIERTNLKVAVIEEYNEDYAIGKVFKQSEKALSTVPVGTVIEITVSASKDAVGNETHSDKKTPKKVSLKLTGLSKTSDATKVKIMLDGVRVYEGAVPTTTGTATVTFEVAASANLSHSFDIYYDDVYRTTKEVE